MKMTIGLIALLLVGCTVSGDLTDESRDKHYTCTDTRDGEVFSFSGSTVTQVRAGVLGGSSSFTVIDDSGEERTLRSNMEVYLKCEEN